LEPLAREVLLDDLGGEEQRIGAARRLPREVERQDEPVVGERALAHEGAAVGAHPGEAYQRARAIDRAPAEAEGPRPDAVELELGLFDPVTERRGPAGRIR